MQTIAKIDNDMDFLFMQPIPILNQIFLLVEKKDLKALFLTSKWLYIFLNKNAPKEVWNYLSIRGRGIDFVFRILFTGRYSNATSVRIAGVNLTQANLIRLFELKIDQNNLRGLVFSGTQIGIGGAKVIARALKINTNLKSLRIDNNEIKNDGAKAIAEALEFNTSLTHLSLSVNKIGNEGARAIATALRFNRSLKSLDLSGNKIKTKGALAIARALEFNITLDELSLLWNKIGYKGLEVIVAFDRYEFSHGSFIQDLFLII